MNDVEPNSTTRKFQRKYRNLLLQPFLQIKLALVTILLTIFFAVVTVCLIYLGFNSLYQSVLDVTHMGTHLSDIVREQFDYVAFWLESVVLAYVFIMFVICIVYTHKLIGPTMAFRRYIAELKRLNFDAKVHLRKGDAFKEVANELNELGDVLKCHFKK